MSPTARVDAADRAGASALFFFLLALYTLTFAGLPDNPDAEVEFQTVHALARQGSLALGETPEARAIVAAEFDVAPGGPGREGRWYSWFGVGQALAALPFYWAGAGLARVFPDVEERHAQSTAYGVARSEYGSHLAVGWRNPLLAAATVALLFLGARRLGASRKSALLAALAFGVATFFWAQARSTLSDVQATFCLALAFERWLALRAAERANAASLAVAGGALALALLTRVAVAPAAAVLALAFAWSLRARSVSPRAWCAFLAPLAAGLALFLAVNHLRFGSVLATGYPALSGGELFPVPPHEALAGLLVSPGRGLAWMAPLVLLAPFGLRAARSRGERAWPALALAVALAVVAPVLLFQTWHGAWTYGPRYLLPCLPLLWPAVALALDQGRERVALRISAVLLALLGLATSLAAVLVDPMTEQDLALQAARVEWPDAAGDSERERDDARFTSMQWSWRFAAPWAHWRIAAARARGADDVYSARELFGVDSDEPLRPAHERERGWRHLAWVDLAERLAGPAWLGPAAALLALAGAGFSFGRLRAQARAQPSR